MRTTIKENEFLYVHRELLFSTSMEFVFRQNRVSCERPNVDVVFVSKSICGFATTDEIGLVSQDGNWKYFETCNHNAPLAAFIDDSATCLILSYSESSDAYLIAAGEQSSSPLSVLFQTTLQTKITAADGELLGTADGHVLNWSVNENKLEIKDLATFDSEIVQVSTRKSLALASTRTLAKVFAILDASNQY